MFWAMALNSSDDIEEQRDYIRAAIKKLELDLLEGKPDAETIQMLSQPNLHLTLMSGVFQPKEFRSKKLVQIQIEGLS